MMKHLKIDATVMLTGVSLTQLQLVADAFRNMDGRAAVTHKVKAVLRIFGLRFSVSTTYGADNGCHITIQKGYVTPALARRAKAVLSKPDIAWAACQATSISELEHAVQLRSKMI